MGVGTPAPGHLRKWLHFDGVDNKVTVNSITNIQPPWTVFIYFKDMKNRAVSNLITKKHNGVTYEYQMYMYLFAGEIFYMIYNDSSGSIFLSDSFSLDNPNGLNLVSWSYDGNASKVYLNGQLKQTINKTLDVAEADTPLQIGWHGNSGWYFGGNLYSFILYNQVLSDEEISQMYDYVVNGKGSMITDGLVLWLDGDSIDPANNVWHDKSGNSNDGTIYGATYNSNINTLDGTRPMRKWLHFDGVDDYVDCGKDETLNTTKYMTAMIYLKINGLTNSYQMFFNRVYNASWSIGMSPNANKFAWYVKRENETSIDFLFTGNPEIGKKVFLVMTYDYENGKAVYVDTSKIGFQNITGELNTTTYSLRIGEQANGIYKSKINVYFAAFYNRALSDEEISQMYDYVVNGKGSMITDGLVLWLDGDSIDPANNVWHDKSGNGNDGTIYGATYNSNMGVI